MAAPPSGGGAAGLAERFGPVVLRRYGSGAEIFSRYPTPALVRGFAYVGFVMSNVAYNHIGHGSGGHLLFYAASLGAFAALLQVPARWGQRKFSRVPRADQPGDVAPGTLVRVVGTVEADGKLCWAPATDRAVVFARNRFFHPGVEDRPGPLACEEIRGTPFRLRLTDGVTVRLLPADVVLTQPPTDRPLKPELRRALGSAVRGRFGKAARFCEDTLAPGDRIEAVGRIATEVSASGDGAPARGVPLIHTLRPVDRRGVLVRRLSR